MGVAGAPGRGKNNENILVLPEPEQFDYFHHHNRVYREPGIQFFFLIRIFIEFQRKHIVV